MFFISIIADCLESVIDSAIHKNNVAISKDYANKPIDEIKNNWIPPVNIILFALVGKIKDSDINDYINNKSAYTDLCIDISSLISMHKQTSGPDTFDNVKHMISNG